MNRTKNELEKSKIPEPCLFLFKLLSIPKEAYTKLKGSSHNTWDPLNVK